MRGDPTTPTPSVRRGCHDRDGDAPPAPSPRAPAVRDCGTMVRSPRRRSFAGSFAAVLACSVITACGDDGPDAGRFCGEVLAHRDELVDPQLSFEDDIDPLLALYRDIGELAPLAIERDWAQLVLNYETAATVVPGDTESEQRAVEVALRSEGSAAEVSRWLQENCGVDLGPVTTIVPQP